MNIVKQFIEEILKEDASNIDPVSAVGQYAHRGQTRRTGQPYFSHPENVAKIVKKYYPANKVAWNSALLHDTFEDAIEQGNVVDEEELISFIHDAIEEEKLASRILEVVMLLTKPKGANYTDYLLFLSKDPDALIVKLADMLDNSTDNPSPRQKTKYSTALESLQEYFGGIPNGINESHWEELQRALS
tara:strand:- start:310 stop:873 length:564 start_codon:yes stop_codon:yes gene_type:complete